MLLEKVMDEKKTYTLQGPHLTWTYGLTIRPDLHYPACSENREKERSMFKLVYFYG